MSMGRTNAWSASGGNADFYKCATVTQAAGGGGTWTGYLYDSTTKTVASATTSLSYDTTVAPVVGKFYSADATMLCDPFASSGLLFSAALSSDANVVTSQTLTAYGSPTFVDGMLAFNGSCGYECDDSWFPFSGDRTVEFNLKIASSAGSFVHTFLYAGTPTQYDFYIAYSFDDQQFRIGDTQGYHRVNLSYTLSRDVVHAIKFIMSNGTTSLYVDDTFVTSASQSYSMAAYSHFCIGYGYENGSRTYFLPSGVYMSAVKIYNIVK